MKDLKTDISTGDIVIEKGDLVMVDRAEEVGQAIVHALRLWKGEWRPDTRVGTDYRGRILGKSSKIVRDAELRSQIAGADGVQEVQSYETVYDGATRILTVSASVLTIYGEVVQVSIASVGGRQTTSSAASDDDCITAMTSTGMI